jgi:hypothetical protein
MESHGKKVITVMIEINYFFTALHCATLITSQGMSNTLMYV